MYTEKKTEKRERTNIPEKKIRGKEYRKREKGKSGRLGRRERKSETCTALKSRKWENI